MAVTERDVRHIAELARLGLDPDRVAQLVGELNGILAHMEELSAVEPSRYAALDPLHDAALPLRADGGPPDVLRRPREAFAPEMRDGFFIVPRLATHEASDVEEAP